MSTMDSIDASLDLLRRLNPKDISSNVEKLCSLKPEMSEELLSSVDQPLQIKICPKTSKEFLICDYNRDGDSYRSPWSNEYDPPLNDGTIPSKQIRELEIDANAAFDVYRTQYFEGGLSSVYLWDLDDGFAGVILIRKDRSTAVWNSIHVFEALDRGRSWHYKLTSTVILSLSAKNSKVGEMDLNGNMTRQVEQDLPVTKSVGHIQNVGKMVEDMEIKMRNFLQEVYFGKAKDVSAELHSVASLNTAREEKKLHQEMLDNMAKPT